MMGFVSNDESSNNNNNVDDDISKWERLYNNYQPPQSSSSSSSSPSIKQNKSSSSDIRIITFDLDNTLWKTSETITHANTVLFDYLLQSKFGIEVRTEVEMGKLFQLFPERYCGIDDDEEDDEEKEIEEEDVGMNRGVSGVGGNYGNEQGRGGIVEYNDEEYANSVQNVGRTEIINLPLLQTTTTTTNKDDGVHIQTNTKNNNTTTKMKKPVYLTLLRKDAIRSLILEKTATTSLSLLEEELDNEVDAAFHVWMEARSQSISQNFVPFAVKTLSHLKSSLVSIHQGGDSSTSSSNNEQMKKKKVYIGAITDGNSNPQSVPELAGFFDFVIKAEDVGVSKPDKRVYKAAVAEVMLQLIRDGRSVEEFFLGDEFMPSLEGSSSGGGGGGGVAMTDAATYLKCDGVREPSWKDVDPDAVEAFSEAVGPWWVHIGDDFFKDIVAAKEFRMRSVWVRELIGGARAFGGSAAAAAAAATTSERTRSVEDLVEEIAKSNGVITMAIGDSDFLTSALHEEFSDAILDRFADLSNLLIKWNEEGTNKSESVAYSEEVIYPNVETILPRAESFTSSTPPQNDETDRASTKFCFACGEKIPAVAKFCPGCGERQA
jgi:FMN phosphatase YigB (HAD superfamily)